MEEGGFETSCKGNGKEVFETSCEGNGKVDVALHIHVSKWGKRGKRGRS